jgi:hypothetical protein
MIFVVFSDRDSAISAPPADGVTPSAALSAVASGARETISAVSCSR